MNRRDIVLIVIVVIVVVSALLVNHYMFPQRIAYINTGKILEGYQGMIDARKEFESLGKAWQSNIDTLTFEFQEELKKYEKEQGKMSPKERELSERVLQTKQQQLIQYQQALKQKAQEEDSKLTEAELKKVNAYIEKFGKENGYKIIFGTSNGNILYAEESTEVTQKVLEGLNKEYKGNK